MPAKKPDGRAGKKPVSRGVTTGQSNQHVSNPQQELFLDHYLDVNSSTFGNAYQSALAAGYSEDYAKHITAMRPEWLADNSRIRNLEFNHLTSIADNIATTKHINSKSPDDTRLKAVELSAKLKGLLVDRKEVKTAVIKVDLGQAISPD